MPTNSPEFYALAASVVDFATAVLGPVVIFLLVRCANRPKDGRG